MKISNVSEKIWSYLSSCGFNEFAVSGIMGNLYAESMLKPNNLQNTYEAKLGYTDDTYTTAVDNGTYTHFCDDRAGYGLAQWTHPKRKKSLYQYAKSKRTSIGDIDMQLEFIVKEIKSSSSLYKSLNDVSSVSAASDIILCKYENPYNQSDSVKEKRCSLSQVYYDTYAKKREDMDSKESQSTYFTYIVKRGDSLWRIAKQYLGSGNRYKEILRENGGTGSLIHVGDALLIPTT